MPKSSMAMVTPMARIACRLAILCLTSSMIRLSVISSSSPAAACASTSIACLISAMKPRLRNCSGDTFTAIAHGRQARAAPAQVVFDGFAQRPAPDFVDQSGFFQDRDEPAGGTKPVRGSFHRISASAPVSLPLARLTFGW